MKQGTTGHADVQIGLAPEAVYAVVSDVTRMGEWSPETVKCEWLDGASGPAVGARFKGANKSGIVRWSTKPRAVTADGAEFAFITEFRGKDSTKWTYRFEPDGDGTKLTESFEFMNDMPGAINFLEKHVMRIKDRKANLEENMQSTLERIKAAVEKG